MLGWSKAALGFEGMLDAEAGEGSSAGQRFSKDLCPQGSVGFEANASDVNTHGLKAVLFVFLNPQIPESCGGDSIFTENKCTAS